MLNHCVLAGNLGADPELFFSSDGVPVASFNLAFKSRRETCWVRVVCFNRLAETAEKHLHKGARIAVTGSLDQQRWEAEGGSIRSSFQIVAGSIEFIKTDGRGFENHENGGHETDD